MTFFAISDLHLPAHEKPMDVFGAHWENHFQRIREDWTARVREEDVVLLPGDLTWAMRLEDAQEDLEKIQALPGTKLLLRGNHDYWWSTASKFYKFCIENGFSNQYILNNNHYTYGDWAICGTRGWFFEEDAAEGSHNDKIFKRELIRLETSLKAAGEKEKICFLHYPPRYRGYECPEILALLKQYGVSVCCYGHLHSDSHKLAIEGVYDGVDFRLCSADFLRFQPIRLK